MALVEVTLNSYRYHFRRLTWQEARLKFSKNVDQRKTIMARALVDVSGLPVTPEQALRTMRAVMLAHKSSRERRTVEWGEAVD